MRKCIKGQTKALWVYGCNSVAWQHVSAARVAIFRVVTAMQ